MKRRGVSPIVAAVLLIMIVVVLALIIFLWSRAFLSEKAVKGDRTVEISCANVEFESQVAPNNCGASNQYAALDINNIGNVPIYGVKIFRWIESQGTGDEIDLNAEQFNGGTITIGKSASVCLGFDVLPGESFRVVPKLLAEQDGKRIAYTCPEKEGIIAAYIGI